MLAVRLFKISRPDRPAGPPERTTS